MQEETEELLSRKRVSGNSNHFFYTSVCTVKNVETLKVKRNEKQAVCVLCEFNDMSLSCYYTIQLVS